MLEIIVDAFLGGNPLDNYGSGSTLVNQVRSQQKSEPFMNKCKEYLIIVFENVCKLKIITFFFIFYGRDNCIFC